MGKWVGISDNMVASGLGCRKALVGTGWAISLFFCMNGIRKEFSGLVGPPFLTMRAFNCCIQAVIG